MVRMQPTRGEYTSKGGASLKTQNKKKEGGDQNWRNGKNGGKSWREHSQA